MQYIQNGGWAKAPNPNGTKNGTPGLGAWWIDDKTNFPSRPAGPDKRSDVKPQPIISGIVNSSTDVNYLKRLAYIYCPPNSLACQEAAIKAGMGIPHGCQFVKPNISNKPTPPKETFTDGKEILIKNLVQHLIHYLDNVQRQ